MSWKVKVALAAAILGGLVLRIWNIDRFGLNGDEAVYVGQAANLAGYTQYAKYFALVRAHPLLYQFIVSLLLRISFNEMYGRFVSAAFSTLTIIVVYLLGKELDSRRTGLIAAYFLAVMPCHIILARQALLDSTMTFFFTLAMYFFAKYLRKRNWIWASAFGVSAGLAFLAKEIALIIVLVIAMFSILFQRPSLKHLIVMGVAYFLTILPHIIVSMILKGVASSYLIWQISRPANHPPWFYLENFPTYFGIPMIPLMVAGIAYAVYRKRVSAALYATWILVVLGFIQLWPLKGFHYILPVVPAVALLTARVIDHLWTSESRMGVRKILSLVLIGMALAGGLYVSLTESVLSVDYSKIGLAGYSGLPSAREAALWIRYNTPERASVLTIGPTMLNVIKFYADRDGYAMSVSPNPLKRNPMYENLDNPDFMIRWGRIHYIVYDVYTASRTSHFANAMLAYIAKYDAKLVHVEYGYVVSHNGTLTMRPTIMIYELQVYRR